MSGSLRAVPARPSALPVARPLAVAMPIALAAMSGSATALAYPEAALRPLAFVALVPFLLAVKSVRGAGAAAVLGLLWMLAFAWGINDWFPRAVARYGQTDWSVGLAFFFGVTVFTAAPATVSFAAVYRVAGRAPREIVPLLAAAAWTTGELVRARLLGDPWGLLGYSQAGAPVWIQIAELGGVYAVGFVVVLVNAALAELLYATARGEMGARALLRLLAATLPVPALALCWGVWRLDTLADAAGPAEREVLVVQGDLDLADQWQVRAYGENLERYLALTRQGLAGGHVDLVVWPESAVTFFLQEEDAMRARIAAVLGPAAAALIVGGPRTADRLDGDFRNSAFALGEAGTIVGFYDKQNLLPFAEYRPRALPDLVRRSFDGVREFRPGDSVARLLEAGGLRAGVVICNEALFSEPASDRVGRGADLLLAMTNDSWVGEARFAEQAFDKAVLRAVEQRRYLVRASTSGPSAIVDDAGRVVARTATESAAVLRGRVVPRHGRSFYARFGDLFAWACAGLVVAFSPWARRRGGTDR